MHLACNRAADSFAGISSFHEGFYISLAEKGIDDDPDTTLPFSFWYIYISKHLLNIMYIYICLIMIRTSTKAWIIYELSGNDRESHPKDTLFISLDGHGAQIFLLAAAYIYIYMDCANFLDSDTVLMELAWKCFTSSYL